MSDTIFCDQCRAQIKAGARFCAQCGAPVAVDSAARAQEPLQPAPTQRAGRRGLAIAATTIGVLAVIAGGIGYAHYAGFLSFGFLSADAGAGEYLYLVAENDRWGFIDASGRVVIPLTEPYEDPDNEPPTAVGPPILIHS